MKKILIILCGLLLPIGLYSQSVRVYNQNIEIKKTTPVLDLNGLGAKIYFDGATSGTTTLQPPAVAGAAIITLPSATGTLITNTDTAAMMLGYGRQYIKVNSLGAGVVTDVTTTLTTEPYHYQIFTSGGQNISSLVSDSLALTGGVYHLHIYSVDAITNAKIKFLY
jgi:hypothetical protein